MGRGECLKGYLPTIWPSAARIPSGVKGAASDGCLGWPHRIRMLGWCMGVGEFSGALITFVSPRGERAGSHGRTWRAYGQGMGADRAVVAAPQPPRPAADRPSGGDERDSMEAPHGGALAGSASAPRPLEALLRAAGTLAPLWDLESALSPCPDEVRSRGGSRMGGEPR